MNILEHARKLRSIIEKAAASLPDEDALEAVELFPKWNESATYAVGDRVQYNSVLYACLIPHTAQANWSPVEAHSLWTKVLIPDPTVVPNWEQPDSTNAYKAGDTVAHNGKTWTSDIDNNVWEPGVYGWSEVNPA